MIKKLTKKQIKDIARIYAGTIVKFSDSDPWSEPELNLNNNDRDIIAQECRNIGLKLLKNDPAFEKVNCIIKYVINI